VPPSYFIDNPTALGRTHPTNTLDYGPAAAAGCCDYWGRFFDDCCFDFAGGDSLCWLLTFERARVVPLRAAVAIRTSSLRPPALFAMCAVFAHFTGIYCASTFCKPESLHCVLVRRRVRHLRLRETCAFRELC
jgi:hypothetical protein